MLQQITDFLFQYDYHFKRTTPNEEKRKFKYMWNLSECNTDNNLCFPNELKCESSLGNVFDPLGITSQVISYPHNVFWNRHFMFPGATSEALFLGFQAFSWAMMPYWEAKSWSIIDTLYWLWTIWKYTQEADLYQSRCRMQTRCGYWQWTGTRVDQKTRLPFMTPGAFIHLVQIWQTKKNRASFEA